MDDAALPSQAAVARVSPSCAPRPYHHGDLRRALVEAAERVLERDGPQALSLRAVAREAGVSPAAPYHHFKDKSDLMAALADEGFRALGEALDRATQERPDDALSAIGIAYVHFARGNPALYRVMYDSARDADAMPKASSDEEKSGMKIVKAALIRSGVDPSDEKGLELGCVAAWCAAHGVAEMAGFAQFRPLVAALGGEDAFVRALLHLLVQPPPKD